MSVASIKSIRRAFSQKRIISIFEKKLLDKNNTGIDGVNPKLFHIELDKNIEIIRKKVKNGTYRFTPYAETLLTKGRDKAPRLLALPTIRDQLTLSCLKEYLHANFEEAVNKNMANTYVFQIANKIHSLAECDESFAFIKTDISGFYDNIDREKLMNFVRSRITDKHALKLIYNAISNPIVPSSSQKNKRYHFFSSTGVPQGLAISNILAGIYMQRFDKIGMSLGELYVRYVDDILVICKQRDVQTVTEYLNFEVSKLGLSLHESKTEVGIIGVDSFDFLGYQISASHRRGYKEVAKIGVRKSSIEKLITSLSAKLVSADSRKDKFLKLHTKVTSDTYKTVLVDDLNERITGAFSHKKRYGWLFYFSQINDMSLLHRLDRIVVKLCERCDVFEKKRPDGLKTFVQAYREIHKMRLSKVMSSTYIPSYDEFSLEEKIKFLTDRGIWPGGKKKDEDEINTLFDLTIKRRMSRLERDIRGLS